MRNEKCKEKPAMVIDTENSRVKKISEEERKQEKE